ncbi:MAG: hypothetical protein ABJB01_07765 [Rudaea sp.]
MSNHTAESSGFRYVKAILCAGALAATFDLIFACTFHGIMSHVTPDRVLKSIASGWLGMDAFTGGIGTELLGFFSHYGILIGAAALYCLAAIKLPWMNRNALVCGAVFGVCIYAFMHLVVLPLSNAPHFKATVIGTTADFSMHVLVIGPTIALVIRRWLGSAPIHT